MIINYLIKALCEKDNVYVNNLGMFRKEYAPAQIKDGIITPPGYKLVYDPDYDGNGFGFTMFVSQKGSMLITEATTQIDQWVAQLKTALDNNKSVSFENFGTFAKNSHGIISFDCDRISELNTEYEGMEPVSFGIQKGNDVEEDVKNETDIKGVGFEVAVAETENKVEATSETKVENMLKGDTENTEETVEDVIVSSNTKDEDGEEYQEKQKEIEVEEEEEEDEEDKDKDKDKDKDDDDDNEDKDKYKDKDKDKDDDDDDDDNNSKKKRGWIIWLIVLLILALLAAAAYYFRGQLTDLYHQYFGKEKAEIGNNQPTQQNTTSVVPNYNDTVSTDSLAVQTDSLSATTNQNTAELETVTSQSSNNQLQEEENFFIDYEQGKYYVISGSFSNEKDVRKHIKDHKLEQYNPKVVRQSNTKKLRICIAIFDSEEAAENYGRQTGLKYWVLK